MNTIYTQYFQKSKVFLYPLLELKKGISYVPAETYICWDNVYTEDDLKFMCLYNTKLNTKFINFENEYLKLHPFYETCYTLDSDQQLYVFDFKKYENTLKQFKNGKYSKFDANTKDIIIKFFGKTGSISQYVNSFLNPENYHGIYAETLNVPLNIIKEVYEICSKPDLKKETLFKNPPVEMELFNNNSISLTKK